MSSLVVQNKCQVTRKWVMKSLWYTDDCQVLQGNTIFIKKFLEGPCRSFPTCPVRKGKDCISRATPGHNSKLLDVR